MISSHFSETSSACYVDCDVAFQVQFSFLMYFKVLVPVLLNLAHSAKYAAPGPTRFGRDAAPPVDADGIAAPEESDGHRPQ